MPLDHSLPYPARPRLSDPQAYIGCRGYFITVNTLKRKKLFVQGAIVQELVRCLKKIGDQEKFAIIAYCFMPDHVHIVLSGTDRDSDLEKFVKQYKQATGYYLKKKFGYKTWAYSYYDSILKTQDDLQRVVQYTFLNPVRAGMVKKITDYAFLGSFTLNSNDIKEMDNENYL